METKINTLPFGGIEAVTTIQASGLEGSYVAIYNTNQNLFVYRKKDDISSNHYETCKDDGLYNDRIKNTVRQDTLFSLGKDIYAYNQDSGRLDRMYSEDDQYVAVTATDVFDEVYKQTEYYSAKRTGEDDAVYQNVRATKYNNELLFVFFIQAAETCDVRLKDFVTYSFAMAGQPEGYYRAFKRPSRYDSSMWELAKSSLRSFFIHYVTARWIEMCGADAAIYNDNAAADMEDIRQKLYDKDAPGKKAVPDGTSTETKGGITTRDSSVTTRHKYIKG